LLALSSPSSPGEEPWETDALQGTVSQEVVEAKIREVDAATGMEEQAKTKLVELYRKALSNLQAAASNERAAEEFRQASEAGPAEVRALRQEMDEAEVKPPEKSLEADLSTPLPELEQLLQKEKADLVAVDAKRADMEKRLESEADRPKLISGRLTEAKQQQEEVITQQKLPPPADEGPATTEARRWVLETRYRALSAEIKMLDRELLSQPVRLDLLKAKRDKAAASGQWIGTRIKILEDLVNRKRQANAQQAKAAAEETRRKAEGEHPLVVDLAERNAALSEAVALTASHLDELAAQAERADKRGRQIEEDFQLAKETFEIGGLSEDLGQMLYQQRLSLPDPRFISRVIGEREKKAAEMGLRRVRHRAEERRLRDLDAYLDGILTEAAAEETPSLRENLERLAKERRELLDTALVLDDSYLRKFAELDAAQRRALDAIRKYDAFLNEHLLWARSSSRTRFEALGAVPEQVWRILSPSGWAEVARTLAFQATHSPVFVLLGLVLGVLLWSRRRMVDRVLGIGDKLGKPTTDRFSYSLEALILTLIAAAAWPLVTAVIGWQLDVSSEATEFSSAVGESLIAVAAQFFYLRAFRLICMRGGLAAEHFRWSEASLRLLRAELDRLTWVFLPAALVTTVSFHLDPLNFGWVVGRVAFLIMVGSLAFALYRLLNPKTGVLAGYVRQRERRTFARLHRLWYPLLVASPLVFGGLVVWGYLYTAGTLISLFLDTTWLVVGLVLLNALITRWLLVTRRRLVYEAAMERREAELENARGADRLRAGEVGVPIEVEEPDVDLVALSDTTRELIKSALYFAGFVGLLVIWSEVLPALRILDGVTVWHTTVTVDGEEQILPVTLADIGLALLYLVLTVILARKLPAVLEIMLIHRSDMPAGSRYTATTLTTYAVVTIGAVLVFKTIGADWSKLQWLVAALGVGIGFGLQEIVANFISGIIILFERPVRIGDVVTVGDTDGTVTRIRIRATTIRNWDGKELLVPNKEFITSRLLNWSLSDQTTRILISVGIAYGSNVREAMRLLEQAAREHEDVLEDPAPSVIFESFGDNALTMVLRCFVESVDLRVQTISALNEAINETFNGAGIVIAFPQRDLHLDTTKPLQVELRRSGAGGTGEAGDAPVSG